MLLSRSLWQYVCIRVMPYYAVASGRVPGVYNTWDECKSQVTGFSNPRYRKFNTQSEAASFIADNKTGKAVNRSVHTQQPSLQTPAQQPSLQTLPSAASISTLKQIQQDVIRMKQQLAILQKQFNNYVNSYEEEDEAAIEDVSCTSQDITELKSQVSEFALKVNKEVRESSHKRSADNELVGESKRVARGVDGLSYDAAGYVVVYTDGACSNNGKPSACAGLGVWFNNNHPLNIAEPVTGRATNNVGEIQAAIRALEICKQKGMNQVRIMTDSQFMISSITMWIKKWKKNGWKTASGEVKNKTEFVTLDKMIMDMDVVWEHVRGHQGDVGNEGADELARQGAVKYKLQHK